MSNTATQSIFFAGGGTGGHIFPSLAIAERLAEHKSKSRVHFLISNRSLDAQILTKAALPNTALPAKPMSTRPWHWPAIAKAWSASVAQVKQMIQQHNAGAVVTMGGFVCAPAVSAARSMNVPVLMVNLDAVPGRANRLMAGKADEIFSVYPFAKWKRAQSIGLPLRRSAIGPLDKAIARKELGLDPDRETLLVTGASSGATSINKLMIELVSHAQPRRTLKPWQILHLSGGSNGDELKDAYAKAELDARVEPFCHSMGLAWSAASIAISRSGAGSVAEVWANATPTIFLPYPYHKDQHQKLNAQPLIDLGSATLLTDFIDPMPNARQITGPLLALMSNTQQRDRMAEQMREHAPADGAETIAQWLLLHVG